MDISQDTYSRLRFMCPSCTIPPKIHPSTFTLTWPFLTILLLSLTMLILGIVLDLIEYFRIDGNPGILEI